MPKPKLNHLLPQPRVLRLGFFEDRNVGVGILPEVEELFVGGDSPLSVTLESVRAAKTEPRKRPEWAILEDAAVVENLLKFGTSFIASTQQEIRLGAQIDRIKGAAALERGIRLA